jgi:hypothetical protein
MASKDLMRSLSLRLDPVRAKFRSRLYDWSLGILEQQVLDDFSLFWNAPSRVIVNLHKLFGPGIDDRLRFFLVGHAYSYRLVVPNVQHPVPSNEEVLTFMRRCIDPSKSDIRQNGLLPLSTPVPRLNRRKLHAATKAILAPIFTEKTDPAEPGEWLYETYAGPWKILVRISTSSSDFQVDLEFDVILGMGDLHLDRQLSLHRAFGIGPSAWDLSEPGEEQGIAELIGEYCRFMVSSLSGLLADLEPSISGDEVRQAEEEWKQWLSEVRAERAGRPPRRRPTN